LLCINVINPCFDVIWNFVWVLFFMRYNRILSHFLIRGRLSIINQHVSIWIYWYFSFYNVPIFKLIINSNVASKRLFRNFWRIKRLDLFVVKDIPFILISILNVWIIMPLIGVSLMNDNSFKNIVVFSFAFFSSCDDSLLIIIEVFDW